MRNIILSSASPRRKELLRSLGLEFEVYIPDIDESALAGLPPDEQVRRLSLEKARAAEIRYPDRVIIAADTLVSIDGKTLGKPADYDEAFEMLFALSGRAHTVYSGVTVACGGARHTGAEKTRVSFRGLSADEIDRYIKSGEPMDKAGGYGIQGLGALLVSGIEGDFYNVMGLPLVLLSSLLSRVGVSLL